MKKYLLSLLFICGAANAAETEEFTVSEVGISRISQSMFIVTQEPASHSICRDKTYFRMATPTADAYAVYEQAIAAMKEGRKIRIQYRSDRCLSSGQHIDVFWALN